MMAEKKIYGLPSYDLGDWEREFEQQTGEYIQNQKTGFRVYIQYPSAHFELGTRFIVSDGEFAMGFGLAEGLAIHNVEYPSKETPKIFIGSVGGRYVTDSAMGEGGFVKLADATHFETLEQQQMFLDTLIDAVPRMPATGNHAFRWNGGFGYQIEFSEDLQQKLANGEFIKNV